MRLDALAADRAYPTTRPQTAQVLARNFCSGICVRQTHLAIARAESSLALPLVALAGAVGMSRVFLGVHYPGDVLIGQLIAVLTGFFALHGWR
jgi:hypothetical protein